MRGTSETHQLVYKDINVVPQELLQSLVHLSRVDVGLGDQGDDEGGEHVNVVQAGDGGEFTGDPGAYLREYIRLDLAGRELRVL